MKKQTLLIIAVVLLVGVATTHYLKKADAAEAISTSKPVVEAPAYSIGDVVSDFKLKNVDGKTVSLANYASAKGFIVVFTCLHCPFSNSYEDRIIALDKKFAAQGFPVIAINPNDPEAYEEDSFANMQARAKQKGYTYPFLQDDTQAISKAFGASRTPHIFILKKENNGNVVQYIGAIDDNAQDPSGVSKRYVEDAVNNILGGKPVVTTTTKAVGCAIKWKS
jgi:glutathione peroxidase-family protein